MMRFCAGFRCCATFTSSSRFLPYRSTWFPSQELESRGARLAPGKVIENFDIKLPSSVPQGVTIGGYKGLHTSASLACPSSHWLISAFAANTWLYQFTMLKIQRLSRYVW